MGNGSVKLNNSITVTTVNGTLTVGGDISGSAALTKAGDGTLVLKGNNTYTGITTVSSGTLSAMSEKSLGLTTSLVVNSGGTLLVGASDAINDFASITLNGGRLSFNGTVGENVGALTLTSNSVIDMGFGSAWISFDSLTTVLTSTTRLEIWNYTPGSDGVYFRNSDSAIYNSLNYITFYSGAGNGTFYNALNTSSFSPSELYPTPVPEPETWFTGALLMLGAGYFYWRQGRRKDSRLV